MDPTATADRYFTALAEGDAAEAREALADLRSWIARGGFTTPRAAEALAHAKRRRGVEVA